MVKAIIFDIGDVLITNVHIFDYLVKELNLDRAQAFPTYIKALEELEESNIDEHTFWKTLKEQLHFDQTITYPSPLARSHMQVKAAHDVLNIVLALKHKGYTLALLSNTIKLHKEIIEKLDFFKYFNVKIFSYEVKSRKPYADIYKLALKELEVLPQEAIFIDNNELFIEGAKKVGLQGILFVNSAQLKKELHILGIEL